MEWERFDHVVIGTHADQALALLTDPTPLESQILSQFRYQTNRGYLHGDDVLMPRRRRVWSSWNYIGRSDVGETNEVSVTYWMNRLQNLKASFPIFLSLNPLRGPRDDKVFLELTYEHPIFDQRVFTEQPRLGSLQGIHRTWYCGSYFGFGFHEDALGSGLAAAEGLRADCFGRPQPMAAD
jgi:predicted NAD/FAD-binding protein